MTISPLQHGPILLAAWLVAIAPAAAAGDAVSTARPDNNLQSSPSYWTPQRMRQAKPKYMTPGKGFAPQPLPSGPQSPGTGIAVNPASRGRD
jgi:hypothetical protein